MSNLNAENQECKDWEQRIIDFVEGRGSAVSRRLTKEMIKTFPSLLWSLSEERQKMLKQILED